MNPLQVQDYLLWDDGSISVDPDKIIDYLFRIKDPSKLFVTSINQDIKDYNQVTDKKLSVKTKSVQEFPPQWNIPDKYINLNMDEYQISLAELIDPNDKLYQQRIERLSKEIWMFNQLNLDIVLKTLVFIIDTMIEKNVVWGVGRGSSCSSYLLFLMGLHCVDPVLYDIDINDFLTFENVHDK